MMNEFNKVEVSDPRKRQPKIKGNCMGVLIPETKQNPVKK